MFVTLDTEGPLYGQLIRALKQAILGGRLKPGSRLPATRALAGELALSRNTVLAAYEQLAAEGFIEGRVGSGCYVGDIALRGSAAETPTSPKPAAPLSRFAQRALPLRVVRAPGRQHAGLRYNLQYGLPLVSPALNSAWRRELAFSAERTDPDYPDPQGLPALRAAIADYLSRRRGVSAGADDILIVSGTQQALELAARVLLDEGDLALLEEPHYQGARQAFHALGADVRTVPVDGDGLDSSALPERGETPRLICVTPSHQFPTGAVLTLARRLDLLAWATRRDCWIIEDDYDGEYRYCTRPLAALKSLDRTGRVLYVGSFSKVLFPALRLGYVVMPPGLKPALSAAKWLVDRGCPAIEQAALARLMSCGAFERHLRRSSKELAARRAALLDALAKHCAGRIDVAGSDAGMHVLGWLNGVSHAQAEQLLERARLKGLGLYSAAPYFLSCPARPGLLLGFAGHPVADLDQAVRLLGACLREGQS